MVAMMDLLTRLRTGLGCLWGWTALFSAVLLVLRPVGDEIVIALAVALVTFPVAVAGMWIYLQDIRRSIPNGSRRAAWEASILYSGPFAATAWYVRRRSRQDR